MEQYMKSYIDDYEKIFSTNIINTIDNISDETTQEFLNKYRRLNKNDI